ncbi:hypothetical protein FQN57_002855 [Myotisia sp. PD_48]|nr:hypothetical protein FQN57_002855 [Myotisia sp. PD_48]
MATLEDKFQVLKEVGDGSFGNVVVARVRTAGSNIARRGTMIAIKTMKKTYTSFSECVDLREVIFLRSIPQHPHLVPALDIFLDPVSKRLHICMEYMDGNLYQLMKARDQKYLDGKTVKSILYQILSGLDHIHAHNFFHRDIKPENILVSSAAPIESSTFSRYSNLVTPPSTPMHYTVKIADFGLARETHSKRPYTNYVSTRWYRAPEVLLRAGSYSAPVDMWAIGAMAVEIATLKPLFPGGNEVDQVWRICEIMGSPGNWYSKSGARIGGCDWRDGIKLAQRLGFSFPKMAPHSLESILPTTQWPASLSHFVTWCLMWDPKARPTSTQALNHEYFADAVESIRPRSSTSRLLGRRQSEKSFKSKEADSPSLSSKPSWFRRSLIGRESPAPAPVLEHRESTDLRKPVPEVHVQVEVQQKSKSTSKRATWANGAPMPILPSIRPVSPLSNAVTAQGNSAVSPSKEKSNTNANDKSKKVGRQLSVNSNGNHYSDIHRQEAERALIGGGLTSPVQKESFFAHLRKRARRLSGRNQATIPSDDVEANAASVGWSNRSSMVVDSNNTESKPKSSFSELDRALQSVRYSLDISSPSKPSRSASQTHSNAASKSSTPSVVPSIESTSTTSMSGAPVSSRTRRALQVSNRPMHRYETPEEEDELLQEVLHSTTQAAKQLGQGSSDGYPRSSIRAVNGNNVTSNPYPTPSPTAKRDGMSFIPDPSTPSKPRASKPDLKDVSPRQWPTPPYDDNQTQWSGNAAAGIYAAGTLFR